MMRYNDNFEQSKARPVISYLSFLFCFFLKFVGGRLYFVYLCIISLQLLLCLFMFSSSPFFCPLGWRIDQQRQNT